MTGNSDLARIYGSDSDSVFIAPYGTTLPTTLEDTLDALFEDIGWLDTDGLTESLSGSVDKKRGHQGNRVVRQRMNETGTSIAFVGLETKPQTLSLRYDEKSVSTTAGVRKATRGAGQKISVRSAVIDLYDVEDDEVQERLIIPRFEISPNGDRVAGPDIAKFPFMGEIIGDYIHLMKAPVA